MQTKKGVSSMLFVSLIGSLSCASLKTVPQGGKTPGKVEFIDVTPTPNSLYVCAILEDVNGLTCVDYARFMRDIAGAGGSHAGATSTAFNSALERPPR